MLHCDIEHAHYGINSLIQSKHDGLVVWDSEGVMRGITYDEMKDRNLVEFSEEVVRLEKTVQNSFKFKFHQKEVGTGKTFEMRMPGYEEIDPHYCTTPGELGERLNRVVETMEKIYDDLIWDLAEIKAGSIAQPGHLVDFEFEFEVIGN